MNNAFMEVITNSVIVQRYVASPLPGTMVYGPRLDGLDQATLCPKQEGVCFRRCACRRQEPASLVRDALKRFERCSNTRLSNGQVSRRWTKNTRLLWQHGSLSCAC